MSQKQLSEEEYQQMIGRLGALELLTAQAWVYVLKSVKDEHREEVILDALIAQEDRWERFDPIARAAALDSAEGILTSALKTVRRTSDGA